MSQTHYTDPSGFEESTVSTASDQVKLAREAMADPTFAQIVAKPSARLPVVGRVLNYNELVGHDGYVGIKTGSDSAAGGCLLFAKQMTVDGHTFTVLGAIFGQHDGELVERGAGGRGPLADSVAAAVQDAGRDPGRDQGDDAGKRRRRHGRGEDLERPLREIGWPGMRRPRPPQRRPGPPQRRAGRTVGDGDDAGTSVARAPAVAAASLGEPSLGWRLQHLP